MWTCPKCGRNFKNRNQQHYCGTAPETVAGYIAAQETEKEPYLIAVREAIRSAIPEAEERIRWSMPSYWKGCDILSFAAGKNHIGLYAGEEAVTEFREQLRPYETEKGTIRIPYREPLPLGLIGDIAEWCFREFAKPSVPGRMQIRQAEENDYEAIAAFYGRLIEWMRTAEYDPGWKMGVYPSEEYLRASIQNCELFVGVSGGEIIAAMIVNQDFNEEYRAVDWPTAAEMDEVSVIHTLGVLPEYSGKGYAKELVRYAAACARKKGRKALRLDVIGGNLPAEELYTGFGFRYVMTMPMLKKDTGWTDFKLYEYAL